MKKFTRSLVLLLSVSTATVFAQEQKEKIRLSAGADAGILTGNANDMHGWNMGAFVQAEVGISKNVFLTAGTGFENYFAKSDVPAAADVNMIPVVAGFRYYIPSKPFYLGGGYGMSYVVNKGKLDADDSMVGTHMAEAGYLFKLKNNSSLDAGVRFNRVERYLVASTSQKSFSLRVAYSFLLK